MNSLQTSYKNAKTDLHLHDILLMQKSPALAGSLYQLQGEAK
ncbi:MAG: hypothetical protein ACOYZ6_09755 [Chloroflexota bacterium]